jgi:PAS domain S-box-containing protein
MNNTHSAVSYHSRRSILNSSVATNLVIAILYFVLAKTGFLFTSPSNNIAPIFLATGLGLAAVLILGRNALLGIWFGSFFANVIHLFFLVKPFEQSITLSSIVSICIATGAMLGAGVGAFLLRYFCKEEHALHSGKNVLILLTISSMTYATITTTFGTLSLSLGGYAPWEQFAHSWWTWWLSDAVGAIVLAPFILAWYYKDSFKINFSSIIELIVLGAITVLLCIVVFFQQGDLKYLFIPLVLATAYRFGMRITSTVLVVITIFTLIVTSLGIGPFVKHNINSSILFLDLFLNVITICSLFLAGILAERQRAEDFLKVSEVNLRKKHDILQSTIESPKDISIYSIDRNYEYLSFNSLHSENMKQMDNISISIGMSIKDCILNKDELRETLSVFNKVFLGESITITRQFEINNSYWESRISPIFNQNNEVIGATTISANINERIKAEEALKKSEEKYRNIFENIQDVIFQTDINGIFRSLSPSIKDFTGYTPEELLGRPTSVLQTDDEEPDAVIKLVNEKLILKNFEKLIKTKSGEIITVLLNAKIIFDKNGNKHHIDAIAIDITQKKESERKIANQNEKLQIQNKELEQFAYISSHDLQEPLLTLKYFTELIKADFPKDLNEDINQYLDFILESSDRMQKLVKGLLDYSRIGKQIEMSMVDCTEILNDAISSLSDLIKENKAQINVEQLPHIEGYSVELIQLFQHLITNAIKFKRKEVPLIINIAAKLVDNKWVFSVEDNGIGIEERNKEKIFIIFRRLHDRAEYPGIGIGLSLCKKIVEIHGGTIWVESTFGKGSTINFTIPKK